jgi:hypothetical protein
MRIRTLFSARGGASRVNRQESSEAELLEPTQDHVYAQAQPKSGSSQYWVHSGHALICLSAPE